MVLVEVDEEDVSFAALLGEVHSRLHARGLRSTPRLVEVAARRLFGAMDKAALEAAIKASEVTSKEFGYGVIDREGLLYASMPTQARLCARLGRAAR